METKHTNKNLLVNGLKKLAIALVCLFIGPTLTFMAPGMPDDIKKYAALVLGILLCVLAVYLIFMGIRTIMKSLFQD